MNTKISTAKVIGDNQQDVWSPIGGGDFSCCRIFSLPTGSEQAQKQHCRYFAE
ncbi:MAG TPA: hypothetical protein VJN01_05345 [Xanthomonadales bacterium]|nr:hypothetical protein [Xanthomonadales bacterium]